jgi:multidrug resistance protein MdtO
LIAGLATTGAIKQKFAFRLAGALIGGLILGIGSTVFLFPEMDSITSLAVLVAVIAFAGAWISGGRQYSYVGLQIVFSFYLVAFEDFRPPTSLAPPRDRLMGILLALLVMWFVFDQIWPVRTVTAMRKALASLLRNEAELFRTELADLPREELIQQTDVFRDHMGKTMAAIRTMNDAVEYEFGAKRQEQIDLAERILRGALITVALVWNEISVLHDEDDADFLTAPGLRQIRKDLSVKLDELAALVTHELATPYVQLTKPLPAEVLDNPRYIEYARQTIDRFFELQLILTGLRQPEDTVFHHPTVRETPVT